MPASLLPFNVRKQHGVVGPSHAAPVSERMEHYDDDVVNLHSVSVRGVWTVSVFPKSRVALATSITSLIVCHLLAQCHSTSSPSPSVSDSSAIDVKLMSILVSIGKLGMDTLVTYTAGSELFIVGAGSFP